jgi:hypothetical protein
VRDPLGEANVTFHEAGPLGIERPLIRARATDNGLHVTVTPIESRAAGTGRGSATLWTGGCCLGALAV